MSKIVLYLPEPPKIDCKKGDMTKVLENYFTTLGTIPSQLRVQSALFDDNDCLGELQKAIDKIEKIIDEITGILITDVFTTIHSRAQEMEYKVREFLKDIDVYLQKLLLEFFFKIVEIISAAIPNPLDLPIPFLPDCKLRDVFTKDGKIKIKKALRERLDEASKFLGKLDSAINDFFSGEWNIVSPDHRVEELWQKLVDWINKTFDITMFDIVNAMVKFLKKVPIIGQLISALGIITDPTTSLEKIFDELYEKAKKKYQEIRDKLISGEYAEEIRAEMEEKAREIMSGFIDTILAIPIPPPFNLLLGGDTIGELLGIDEEEEAKKQKISIKEKILAKLRDGWNRLMNKLRRLSTLSFVELIMKAFEKVYKQLKEIADTIPIVKQALKVFDFIKQIIDIFRGKVDACTVMNVILKPIFSLADAVYALVPKGCFDVQYTKYGYLPELEEVTVTARRVPA